MTARAAERREPAGDVAGRDADGAFGAPGAPRRSRRWVYLHLIEKYARRNDHADIVRECIDGRNGA
jgi:hypothetical protein